MYTRLLRILFFAMVSLTLSWGQVVACVQEEMEHAIEHMQDDHASKTDPDPMHVVHHSCHHHINDKAPITVSHLSTIMALDIALIQDGVIAGLTSGPPTKPPAFI